MPQITLYDRTIPYTIRQSKRARSLKIGINTMRGVEIIIPFGYKIISADALEDLLQERADWILKNYDRFVDDIPQRHYTTGEKIPYLGHDYTLHITPQANKKRTTTRCDKSTIFIRLRADISPDQEESEAHKALLNWYHKQAVDYFGQLVPRNAKQMDVAYHKISIRNQNTIWGSCSSQGNLNFNVRLMLAPPEAIHYIVIHELCHLVYLNHSTEFWKMVAYYCPDYANWNTWLKENGRFLVI